ncbi:ATP-binding protein [Methylocystis sp. WRRC1]|uniref:ATP-binding protein n=1 Tax=Methylocystis sp. WRRC1 TaxID=1732014 RepID=UPI001D14DEC7|nr:ATP-binding protein [Methylocystis sp. WRRC1]MCC3245606.1 ATP-binding protein [Methylocystis sp. WRRC1]
MPQTKWRDQATDWLAPVIDALPEPVFVVDAEERTIAANGAARALAPAMRFGEPLSRSLRSPDMLDAVGRVLAGGAAEKTVWVERAPVERWFEAHVAPMRVPGYDAAAMISLRDLTEAHRVERMRVDFVANASHELRTPLASLLGFVETLQGPAKNDAAAREKFLGIMREQAQRMARLVDDLLSLSRIEQHMHVRPATPVDLTLLVAHIVDTLTPMAEEDAIPLALDLAPNVIVPGDRDELARIIENLIENALKYGRNENGGEKPIEISLTRKDAVATFSVRDHGPGVAPEHIPRLTERFYRVDAGKSRAKGGTGLGLAIVKHIVLRHQGRLAIESALGEGSLFKVTLPAIDPDAAKSR